MTIEKVIAELKYSVEHRSRPNIDDIDAANILHTIGELCMGILQEPDCVPQPTMSRSASKADYDAYSSKAWEGHSGKVADIAIDRIDSLEAEIAKLRSQLKRLTLAAPQPTVKPQELPVTWNTEAAAMQLAECMDYPWAHMPEQGRQSMRESVQRILLAALSAAGIARQSTVHGIDRGVVYVCPEKDIACGDFPKNRCKICPKSAQKGTQDD